ncbi:hypothetical protein ACLOJK_020381 [Asimina triloba]
MKALLFPPWTTYKKPVEEWSGVLLPTFLRQVRVRLQGSIQPDLLKNDPNRSFDDCWAILRASNLLQLAAVRRSSPPTAKSINVCSSLTTMADTFSASHHLRRRGSEGCLVRELRDAQGVDDAASMLQRAACLGAEGHHRDRPTEPSEHTLLMICLAASLVPFWKVAEIPGLAMDMARGLKILHLAQRIGHPTSNLGEQTAIAGSSIDHVEPGIGSPQTCD